MTVCGLSLLVEPTLLFANERAGGSGNLVLGNMGGRSWHHYPIQRWAGFEGDYLQPEESTAPWLANYFVREERLRLWAEESFWTSVFAPATGEGAFDYERNTGRVTKFSQGSYRRLRAGNDLRNESDGSAKGKQFTPPTIPIRASRP